MKLIRNPSTDSASEASNIDITKREIPALATRNASFEALFKSTTPANVFATLTNPGACHVFCNASKSLRLPREMEVELQKTSRAPGALTILTSKSFSCAGVVESLRWPTSKNALGAPVFNYFDFKSLSSAGVVQIFRRSAPNPRINNFDFQIALAGVKLNFKKCSEPASSLRFWLPKSLSRAGVVQILSTSWAADPPHHLAFRSWLCETSKPRNYGKTQHFAQFLPAKISHVSHLRCKTSSLPSNIDAARPSGNFQYSRKLELLNFLW